MKKTKLLVLTTIITAGLFLISWIVPQEQKKGEPWEIPEMYKKMENPYKDDVSLNKVGKMLYAKHCKSCHGNRGLGDGPMAKNLETFSGDFSSEEFQNQSDGVLFYKSFIGRDEMPNYEKKITDDEDRWAIINFLRTFKK